MEIKSTNKPPQEYIYIRLNYKLALGLVAVIFLLAAFGLLAWDAARVQASERAAPGALPVQASQQSTLATSVTRMRRYYLTDEAYFGYQVGSANACAPGFHMASMWEIIDSSHLEYYHIYGEFGGDQGFFSPPSFATGWVRTGYSSDNSAQVGMANCSNWGNTAGYGTVARPASVWESGFFNLSFWHTVQAGCQTTSGIWCIEDANPEIPAMRQFYITQETYNGGNTLDSCAIGYHMSSLWEIIDPSNLHYNINLGRTYSDSGLGPQSGVGAWVRTGALTNIAGTDTQGMANCRGWATSLNSEYGTLAALPTAWDDINQQDIGFWNTFVDDCSSSNYVWCVADTVDTAGTCSNPEPISCGAHIVDTTTGMASHRSHYSCTYDWDESGADRVYALTLPPGYTYSVTASLSGMDFDLDVFFLSSLGCQTGDCINQDGYGDWSLTVSDLQAGTYYIVVEGFQKSEGNYTLDVSCSPTFLYLPLLRQ
ncbi:MAG: hypothetical protein JW862_06275 [Anaerolineales bacterium]|nr:hypothetical protein [Anaerolineales bacterium]